MYAVIETGGKQYRVSPGQTLEVELLPAEPGAEVTLERVLLVSTGAETLVGTPNVPGGRVIGTVVREGRGKKILVFKFKSKKRYRRLTGHRQDYVYLTVTDIQANGESLVADEERKRHERNAQRAVRRFEAKLLGGPAGDRVFVADEPETDEAEEEAQVPQATTTPATSGRKAAGAREQVAEQTEPDEDEPDETEE